MKNETMANRKPEVKVGLSAATLPWWAKALIAQHVAASFPSEKNYKIHHCAHCDCVLISTNITSQYASGLCFECSPKKRTSQGGN